MTSPDDVIFLKFSEIYGQYFPLSNFKKKDTLVFSSLSSIRLGLSPKGLVKRKRPNKSHDLRTRKRRRSLQLNSDGEGSDEVEGENNDDSDLELEPK